MEQATQINYEDEIYEQITNQLTTIYGNENWFKYSILKYIIHYDKKMEKPDDYLFIQFLLDELKIRHYKNFLRYKNTYVPFSTQIEQSMGNILNNLYMNTSINFNEFKRIVRNGRQYARKRNIIPKTEVKYKTYNKMFLMEYIEKEFNIQYSELSMLDGFEYDDSFYYRSIKDYYLWEKEMYEKDKIPYTLTESMLEDYLFKNLTLIGDLKPVGRQEIIGDGRLDIWSRNKANENVLIECKIVSNPKDLAWQCLHYPSFFKETFNQEIKKIIVVGPPMKDKFKDKIIEKSDIEVEFIHYISYFDKDKKEFTFEFLKKK